MKFVQAKYFHEGRKRDIKYVVLHSTESTEYGDGAEAVANYFATTTRPASAHIVVDNNSAVRCVKDADTAFAAPGANADGLHLEMVGRAAQSADDWSDAFSAAMIDNAVEIVADWVVEYGIPVEYVSVADLKKGSSGITTHNNVSKAFKKSDHYDPGKGFPMKDFIAKVAKNVAARTLVVEETITLNTSPETVMIGTVETSPTIPVVPAKPSLTFPGTLRIKQTGEGVKVLQEALNRKGAKLKVDGIFGPHTSGALRRFERSIGSTNDGILDENTWLKLTS